MPFGFLLFEEAVRYAPEWNDNADVGVWKEHNERSKGKSFGGLLQVVQPLAADVNAAG